MIRPLLLSALAVFAFAAIALAHDNHEGETVRIIARLQADGDIEFGLRTADGNQLPRARIFSASIRDSNWKRSSPIELANGAEVRIIARRSGDTRVEFGLRSTEPQREFLPTRRYFSRATPEAVWRMSTPLLIPAPPHEAEPEEEPEAAVEPQSGASENETTAPQADAPTAQTISGGHRDGLIVERRTIGDPDAPVLIVEYGDPY